MREVDLIIVGASFAGLACARTAAQRGLRVVVVDRKRDPGEKVRTTGILVKEAAEETDFPAHLTRVITGARIYAPNGKYSDHSSPGYYFLSTDTPGILRWLWSEAERAGAEGIFGHTFRGGEEDAFGVSLRDLGLRTRLLIGADGATSSVARAFNLQRNERFLGGVELELEPGPALDEQKLHCFLDSRLAPGYLGWVVPGVGVIQIGLACRHGVRPDISQFLDLIRKRMGWNNVRVVARRSGLIPCGGSLRRTGSGSVLLVGDAAGHVSPLTGGGIVQTLRLGRRCAQLATDWLLAGGEHPVDALPREVPSFRTKLVLRWMMDKVPPDWLWNLAVGSLPFGSFAQQIYFHNRRSNSARSASQPREGREI